MKKRLVKIIFAVLFLCFAGLTKAETVQLDLFTLGMPATFNPTSTPYDWQTDFDLGVTFTQISNVYIDWSGEITAGLAISYSDPCNPFPLEVGIYVSLGYPRRKEVWGGVATYPEPEPFDCLSEIPSGTSAWSDLLDGNARITVGYTEYIFGFGGGGYTQHGSITLDSVILVVEGTIVPEPVTIVLFAAGVIGLRTRKQRN